MADKPPDPAELARFAEQAEKAIERLESRVGRRASKTVTDAIRPVIVEITRLWVAQFGSVTATADPAGGRVDAGRAGVAGGFGR